MKAKKFKYEKKFKSRDERDLNQDYTIVKVQDLKEYKGTIQQFLDQITPSKPGYLYNGKDTLMHLWWEDNERWFMNYGYQSGKKFQKEGWLIAKDLNRIIENQLKDGCIMYLK